MCEFQQFLLPECIATPQVLLLVFVSRWHVPRWPGTQETGCSPGFLALAAHSQCPVSLSPEEAQGTAAQLLLGPRSAGFSRDPLAKHSLTLYFPGPRPAGVEVVLPRKETATVTGVNKRRHVARGRHGTFY